MSTAPHVDAVLSRLAGVKASAVLCRTRYADLTFEGCTDLGLYVEALKDVRPPAERVLLDTLSLLVSAEIHRSAGIRREGLHELRTLLDDAAYAEALCCRGLKLDQTLNTKENEDA